MADTSSNIATEIKDAEWDPKQAKSNVDDLNTKISSLKYDSEKAKSAEEDEKWREAEKTS